LEPIEESYGFRKSSSSFAHVRCDPRLVVGDAGNTEDRAVEATALAFSTQ
jgi:hypothetical protein